MESKEEDYYKDKIIEMVNSIKNIDVLNYIYIIISDIQEERGILNDE